jgi:hypothetical protein
MTLYADLWNLQDFFWKNVLAYNYPKENWGPTDLGREATKTPFYDLPFMPLLGLLVQF